MRVRWSAALLATLALGACSASWRGGRGLHVFQSLKACGRPKTAALLPAHALSREDARIDRLLHTSVPFLLHRHQVRVPLPSPGEISNGAGDALHESTRIAEPFH